MPEWSRSEINTARLAVIADLQAEGTDPDEQEIGRRLLPKLVQLSLEKSRAAYTAALEGLQADNP